MDRQTVSRQIETGFKKAKKSYSYDDDHDKSVPVEMWFQESHEGLILFIVFYSQACRWSQCTGCNLPSKASLDHVDYKSIIDQINSVFSDPEVIRRQDSICKVIISNNGSIFDEKTFSSTALMYFLAQLNINFTNLQILTIETRPEYVDFAELEFMARALEESEAHTQLEIAIGFEALDDEIRNDVFKKGLSLSGFEELVSQAAPYGYRIKCYFMQKPVPGLSDEAAVEDIKKAIDYLSKISDRFGVKINMHLNPTFVARGTILEEAFNKNEYSPPRLVDVARAASHARDKPISVFIGLSDEGLTVEGGSFIRDSDDDIIDDLEQFNRSQNYDILDWLSQKT
jgi:archaeosine synthase beta-subunit